MVSTVQSRPSHYDVLGIDPAASADEIAQAFARLMRMFRPMTESARIGAAYAMLRDPDRRRAYDAELGLAPKPQPVEAPAAVSFQSSARFIGAMSADRVTAAPPLVAPRSAVAEPRAGSFIAASLREPASVGADVDPVPQRQDPSPAEVERVVQAKISALVGAERGRANSARVLEDRPFGWSRTLAAVGALVLAVMGIGVWAGLEASDSDEAEAAKPAVNVALPSARAPQTTVGGARPARPNLAEAQPQRTAPQSLAARPIKRAQPMPRVPAPERLAEVSEALQNGGDSAVAAIPTAVTEEPATEAPATVTPAAMPLPNHVIARTIDRIGYSCGQVANTAAADAPGVFKVTCTSGQSYEAKPVRGRYHFRRIVDR